MISYEKLLAEIDRLDKVLEDSTGISALRAVIKFHKPLKDGSMFSNLCAGCKSELNFYPCPTIEAIEKELKI